MGVGLPVIGSCSGGTPEQVLHEKRGYLIEPKSSESIAKAIEYYIENPQKIHEHGQAAREWVTNEHNWKHTLNELNKLYELALIDRN
jgi:glycosyltransferase involved in cell wall biosynthesis